MSTSEIRSHILHALNSAPRTNQALKPILNACGVPVTDIELNEVLHDLVREQVVWPVRWRTQVHWHITAKGQTQCHK